MSFKTILSDIGSWFSKFFHAAGHDIEVALPVATEIVTEINAIASNPITGSILAMITKNPKVAVVATKVSQVAPVVLTDLGYLNGITATSTETEIDTAMEALVLSIPGMTDSTKQKFNTDVAAGLLKALYDGTMTWGQAYVYVEGYFQTQIAPAKAA